MFFSKYSSGFTVGLVRNSNVECLDIDYISFSTTDYHLLNQQIKFNASWVPTYMQCMCNVCATYAYRWA